MLFLALTVAVVIGLAIFFFFLGLGNVASKTKDEEKFKEMVEAITRSEIAIDRVESNMPDPKTWSGYWYKLAISAGYAPENTSGPGYLAMALPIVTFAFGFLVVPRDALGGLAFAIASIVILRLFFRIAANRRIAALDKQLPNLLSGLRASLQANLTPQQAILAQAEEISAPLGDELKTLRDELSVNIPLDTALSNLALRIPSREVKFLVAATRIAIASGTDLDPLLQTIQEIVVQRARIANHLASAVAQVQPAIVVTGVMIPAALIFSYYSDKSNQAFWATPMGLIALLVVGGLYATGLFIAKKQVDRVKDA